MNSISGVEEGVLLCSVKSLPDQENEEDQNYFILSSVSTIGGNDTHQGTGTDELNNPPRTIKRQHPLEGGGTAHTERMNNLAPH